MILRCTKLRMMMLSSSFVLLFSGSKSREKWEEKIERKKGREKKKKQEEKDKKVNSVEGKKFPAKKISILQIQYSSTFK